MMKMKQCLVMAVLALPVMGLSGCGLGKKLVKELTFSTNDEGGHLVAGFDTRLEIGSGALPEVKLPIYHPNHPSQFLGYLETHMDGGVSVRVDVTEAAKVKVTDGRLLPNGREIPIKLPEGVVPVAVPVINSNSKVYIAVGKQNLMTGVAVTLVADTSTGNSDWLRILRQLSSNIFYPFTIASDLKGNAGAFTGSKVGIGVFAVKTFSSEPAPTFAKSSTETQPEVFSVKTQYPTGYKMYRIQRALTKVRDTAID